MGTEPVRRLLLEDRRLLIFLVCRTLLRSRTPCSTAITFSDGIPVSCGIQALQHAVHSSLKAPHAVLYRLDVLQLRFISRRVNVPRLQEGSHETRGVGLGWGKVQWSWGGWGRPYSGVP